MVQPGRYRHYKGREYEVLGVARHSETEEEYVVYRARYGDRGLWISPTAIPGTGLRRRTIDATISLPRATSIVKTWLPARPSAPLHPQHSR